MIFGLYSLWLTGNKLFKDQFLFPTAQTGTISVFDRSVFLSASVKTDLHTIWVIHLSDVFYPNLG